MPDFNEFTGDAGTPTDGRWTTGQRPWVRQILREQGRAGCMFCGEVTAVASHHDREVDYGRIELYCDNPECEAREFVVLMVRGEGAHMRADVRALAAVDQYAPQAEPIEEDPPEESYDRELSDADMWWRGIHRLRQEAVNSGDVTTRRRLSRSAFRIHVD